VRSFAARFFAEFADGRRIDDTETMSAILSKLNVEPSAVLAAALSDDNKARLRAETEEAQRLGLFGAPSFSTADGELFWGNDRLEHALAWAKQHG
jgi:2-hydroxychromene-2-carboxylate isomerase